MANYELRAICRRLAQAVTDTEVDRCREEMIDALDSAGEYAEFEQTMDDAAYAQEGNDHDGAIRRRFRHVRKHQNPWGQSSRLRRSNVQTPTPNAFSAFRRRTVSPFDPTDFDAS